MTATAHTTTRAPAFPGDRQLPHEEHNGKQGEPMQCPAELPHRAPAVLAPFACPGSKSIGTSIDRSVDESGAFTEANVVATGLLPR